MPITDLTTLTNDFTHPAHLEAYLTAFTDAFLAEKIQAIPGQDITFNLNKKKVTTCSYVVLQDDAFESWHAETVQRVLELTFDTQQVADIQHYGQISEDLFLLFAEQARKQLKAEQPTPPETQKVRKPRAPKKKDDALQETATDALPPNQEKAPKQVSAELQPSS